MGSSLKLDKTGSDGDSCVFSNAFTNKIELGNQPMISDYKAAI